ncbi:glycerol kinase [Limosa lapponica baueri]|uniref:Glycerol kinase n=1 Tax=Limosa lapponica baueri TaxID=1758121 RepID=A0A2I0TTP8_LIMLA|nr:glycerol kinase [Limosa lapponica baueri]
MKRSAMLDLVLTNEKVLVGNVKLKGSLDCSDHEMVEFKNLKAARRVDSKLTLDIRREAFGFFWDLLGRVPWDKALEGKGAQECWLILKDPPSSELMHPNKEKVGQKHQKACMDEQGALGETQTEKRAYRCWKQGQVAWEEYREIV